FSDQPERVAGFDREGHVVDGRDRGTAHEQAPTTKETLDEMGDLNERHRDRGDIVPRDRAPRGLLEAGEAGMGRTSPGSGRDIDSRLGTTQGRVPFPRSSEVGARWLFPESRPAAPLCRG